MSESKISDAFTREKFQWLDQITFDKELKGDAVRIGYALSKFHNRSTGDAWPGLDHLAGLMGTNEKTIRRGIESLIVRGHLDKKKGGKGKSNRYTFKLQDRTELSSQEIVRPDKIVHSKKIKTGQICPDDRTKLSIMTGQKCPTTPFIETIEESIETLGGEKAFDLVGSIEPKISMFRTFDEYEQAKTQILTTHFPELLKQIEPYPDGMVRLVQLDSQQRRQASALLAMKGRDAAKQFVFKSTY